MVPPRWPGEPTYDCPRCGRIVGPLHMRAEHLKPVGWEPYHVVSYVIWCGHAQEIIPFPLPDGGCQFVPVLGGALNQRQLLARQLLARQLLAPAGLGGSFDVRDVVHPCLP